MGSTGIAPRIMEECSTNDMSILGRRSYNQFKITFISGHISGVSKKVTSGGMVGAILCFLLKLLVLRLPLSPFFGQHMMQQLKQLKLKFERFLSTVLNNFHLQSRTSTWRPASSSWAWASAWAGCAWSRSNTWPFPSRPVPPPFCGGPAAFPDCLPCGTYCSTADDSSRTGIGTFSPPVRCRWMSGAGTSEEASWK